MDGVRLTVNGETRDGIHAASVAGLISELGLDGRKVAVERNLEIVPRSLYADTALADGSSLRPEAQAMVEFLGKMTRDPGGLTPGDADKVRHAGVSTEAFDEAVWVGAAFSVINRMMNTFGAGPLDNKESRVGARFIKTFGYKIPPPITLFSRGN